MTYDSQTASISWPLKLVKTVFLYSDMKKKYTTEKKKKNKTREGFGAKL